MIFFQDEGSGIYNENDEVIAEAKSLIAEFHPTELDTKVSLADSFDESKEENFQIIIQIKLKISRI